MSRTGSLNQAWMPKWKNTTAKQATRMVGATATPLNSITSRTWSCEPAEPRRRSTQTRVRRPARTAPNSNRTEILASARAPSMPDPRPNGEPRAMMMKVDRPTASASAARTKVIALLTRIWLRRDNKTAQRPGGGDREGSGLAVAGDGISGARKPAANPWAPDGTDCSCFNPAGTDAPGADGSATDDAADAGSGVAVSALSDPLVGTSDLKASRGAKMFMTSECPASRDHASTGIAGRAYDPIRSGHRGSPRTGPRPEQALPDAADHPDFVEFYD